MARKLRLAEKADPQLFHIHFKEEAVSSIDISSLTGQINLESELESKSFIELGKCDGEPSWGSESEDGDNGDDNYGFAAEGLLKYTLEMVMHGFRNKTISDADFVDGKEGDDNWQETIAMKNKVGTFIWNCPSTGVTHSFESFKLSVKDEGKGNSTEALPVSANAKVADISIAHKRATLQIGTIGAIATISVINGGTGHTAADEITVLGGNDLGAIITADTVDGEGVILTASIKAGSEGTKYAVGNGLIQSTSTGSGTNARFIVATLV